jgi:hypothetical protein
LLGVLFVWAATAAVLQPSLAQIVSVVVVFTAIGALALLALPTASTFVRISRAVRIQWLRSLGVPATGLSGSVPTLILLAQPRR